MHTLRTLLVTALIAAPAVALADTDFLRELARARARIVIGYSGKDALPLAMSVRDGLWGHADWGKRRREDVEVVPASAVESRRAGGRVSVVTLVSGTDPRENLANLPVDPQVLGSRTAAVTVLADSLKAGDLAFRVGLYAPDAPRLARVVGVLTQRRVGTFRDLPFTARFQSNRIAVFSDPGLRAQAERWGELRVRDVWDDVQWHPIARRSELAPEALAERTCVYFADRSAAMPVALPDDAREALRSVSPLSPTAVAVARGQGANGEPVYVVSAPSARLLRTRIESFRDLRTLAEAAGKSRELPDLTRIGMAPLLVVNGGQRLATETIESLHAHLAEQLRALELPIEPRGTVVAQMEAEIAAQLARGASDAQGALRRDAVARYAWVLTVTDVAARTAYRPLDRKLTADLRPFDRAEPDRPRRRRGEADDDYDERYQEYVRAWNRWERDRRAWQESYDRATVDWSQSVVSEGTVRVRGLLQLFDTRSSVGAKPVFSAPWSGEGRDQKVWREQRVQVRGHDARPAPMAVPPAVETCPPEVLIDTLRRATDESLDQLRRETVLPEAGLTLPTTPGPVDDPEKTPGERPAGKVAEVVDGVVALNVGSRQGVRVGDRFEILIVFRETRDPDTRKVLRTKVEERLVVVVRSVEAEVCDAVPESPSDLPRLKRVQVGMPARPLP